MGQQRLIAWTHTALLNETGVIKYVIATGIDITERKQIEVALQESEALLRATFEQLVIGINYTDLDGKFLRANERFCQMLGYSLDEILSLSVAEVTHLDDLEVDLAYLGQMAAGELTSYVMEKRYIRKDGAYVWVNLTVSLVSVPSKALKYTVGVVEDITARKRAEEALRLQL
jgi:PAS domain S-box-containing protein